jgi:hypothetical protein
MNRAARIALMLLTIVLTSPIWGFELAYHLFLPPILPELPKTTEATRLEMDALWVETGERLSPEVEFVWAFNLLRNPRHRGPAGAYAAERVAREWVTRASPPRVRHFRRSLAVVATSVWLSRNASAEDLKRALAEWNHFGRRSVGIRDAGEAYFGCGVSLTLAQEALLIGLLQSPGWDNPINHPDRALARRLHILKSLAAAGVISSEEQAAAAAENAEATVLPAAPVCL